MSAHAHRLAPPLRAAAPLPVPDPRLPSCAVLSNPSSNPTIPSASVLGALQERHSPARTEGGTRRGTTQWGWPAARPPPPSAVGSWLRVTAESASRARSVRGGRREGEGVEQQSPKSPPLRYRVGGLRTPPACSVHAARGSRGPPRRPAPAPTGGEQVGMGGCPCGRPAAHLQSAATPALRRNQRFGGSSPLRLGGG